VTECLLCRTEADKGKHDGLSYLLVPMSTPGIEVRPLVTMTGRAEFNETFLTDVRVPIDQIVIGRGKGWHVANVTLKYERLLLGDPNKLTHRLARVIELMKKTTLDGVRIIEIPGYRDRLLRIQGEVLGSKFHGLRLLTEQAKGEESGVSRHAGRTWGKKGQTPIVLTTGQRRGMSMISAITSRGHLRFKIIEDGSVNADAFIEFIKRLPVGAKRKIFLIVDGGPAHRAKKTKAFVESLQGKLRLFLLPPYSLDRNPDELVWKHVKAGTVGRMVITGKDEKSEIVIAFAAKASQ
jgi:transposase